MTTAANIDSMKAGMAYDDLPALFQAVVGVPDRLDIDFLWIDRLCIIQGDNDDFHTQAAKMGQIYGNATLTSAAAFAVTERDGFVSRDLRTADLHVEVPDIGDLMINAHERTHRLGTEQEGGDYGRMSTRAWIWQERLLAARTISFTPRSIKFECRRYSQWEGDDPTMRGHSYSAQLDNMTHERWTKLIEEFTKRNISRPYDRLPAIKAVMGRIQKSTGWTPFCGIWTDELVQGLCWKSPLGSGNLNFSCKVNPRAYAPSWSWASVEGPIDYAEVIGAQQPQIWDARCVNLDRAEGMIRLSARISCFKIHGDKDPPPRKGEITFGGNPWIYRVSTAKGLHRKSPLVIPDVVLRRSHRVHGGKISTAVERVPYGEAAPTQAWESICLAVLLYTDGVDAISLISGRHLPDSKAWERVGLCRSSSSAFEGLERTFVDVC